MIRSFLQEKLVVPRNAGEEFTQFIEKVWRTDPNEFRGMKKPGDRFLQSNSYTNIWAATYCLFGCGWTDAILQFTVASLPTVADGSSEETSCKPPSSAEYGMQDEDSNSSLNNSPSEATPGDRQPQPQSSRKTAPDTDDDTSIATGQSGAQSLISALSDKSTGQQIYRVYSEMGNTPPSKVWKW